ncbi:MAG: oligopeptide/dipeptide ABC transporter ATP-binding protein [Bacillota bacterium]
MSLLVFDGVVKTFPVGRPGLLGGPGRVRRAVDEVSFSVERGRTYALVGESGCGKTTVARLAAALLRPTRGRVVFAGGDVGRLRGRALAAYRRRVQMVFQDPAGALDPRQRVASAVEEPLLIHGLGGAARRRAEVGRLLEVVGLGQREGARFPHQLSGGQKQRVVIARALALQPELVILDEPVSALDVSVRAQILTLLTCLQRENDLTYLLISHDIGVVGYSADRVGVMHRGRLVEEGPADVVLSRPAHPYTVDLLRAVPVPDPARRPPPPAGPPPEPPEPRTDSSRACLYAHLCPRAARSCVRRRPALRTVAGRADHRASCHLAED